MKALRVRICKDSVLELVGTTVKAETVKSIVPIIAKRNNKKIKTKKKLRWRPCVT